MKLLWYAAIIFGRCFVQFFSRFIEVSIHKMAKHNVKNFNMCFDHFADTGHYRINASQFSVAFAGVYKKHSNEGNTDTKWLTIYEVPGPAGIYLLKFNNRNTRTRCEICLKLTIKTLERLQASFWCLCSLLRTYFTSCACVYSINFEHVIAGWGWPSSWKLIPITKWLISSE